MRDLSQLAKTYRTDKGLFTGDGELLGHDYMKVYEKYIGSWLDKEFTLVEIGVQSGLSIEVWKQYFLKARIYGIDIDPGCKHFPGDNVEIFICDQADKIGMRAIADRITKPSVIIDDGSHLLEDIISSFRVLIKYLENDGYYFIEDIDPNHYGSALKKFLWEFMVKNSDFEVLEYVVSKKIPSVEMAVIHKVKGADIGKVYAV